VFVHALLAVHAFADAERDSFALARYKSAVQLLFIQSAPSSHFYISIILMALLWDLFGL